MAWHKAIAITLELHAVVPKFPLLHNPQNMVKGPLIETKTNRLLKLPNNNKDPLMESKTDHTNFPIMFYAVRKCLKHYKVNNNNHVAGNLPLHSLPSTKKRINALNRCKQYCNSLSNGRSLMPRRLAGGHFM
jgi:hypothetical protein